MRNKLVATPLMLLALLAVFAPPFRQDALARLPGRQNQQTSGNGNANPTRARIIKEVRHELVTLPDYNLFDWLQYEVQSDGSVTLLGQVVRPITKSEAESNVKDIDGVTRVINQIEVLPVSPGDDRLRAALYQAIYNFNSPLFRYATQVVPPIHIIVRNGRVTLKGVVANQQDAQLAYMAARGVPGTFEVKNELQVEHGPAR